MTFPGMAVPAVGSPDHTALLTRWHQSLEANRGDPHLAHRLGESYRAAGQPLEAVAYFERAMRWYIERGIPDRAYALGRTLEERERVVPLTIARLMMVAAGRGRSTDALDLRMWAFLEQATHQGDVGRAVQACLEVLDETGCECPHLDTRLAFWHANLTTPAQAAKRLAEKAAIYRARGHMQAATDVLAEARRWDPETTSATMPQVGERGGMGQVVSTTTALADLEDGAGAAGPSVASNDPAGTMGAVRPLAAPAPREATQVSAPVFPVPVPLSAPVTEPIREQSASVVSASAPLLSTETRRDGEPAGDPVIPVGAADDPAYAATLAVAFSQHIATAVGADLAGCRAHYEVAGAFREMGLYAQAIAEYRVAVGTTDGALRLAVQEELAACFVETGAMLEAFALCAETFPPNAAAAEGSDRFLGLAHLGYTAAGALGKPAAQQAWRAYLERCQVAA